MRYASVAITQQSYIAAREHFVDLGVPIDDDSREWLDLEMQYQMLQRILVAGTGKPLAPDVDQLRAELTPNEVEHLVAVHHEEQEREAAEWQGKKPLGPYLTQIGAAVGLPPAATAEDIVAAVAELVARAEAPVSK